MGDIFIYKESIGRWELSVGNLVAALKPAALERWPDLVLTMNARDEAGYDEPSD